jgi:hypothetical protein
MKQTPVTICEDVMPRDLRRLAAAVITTALRETKARKDPIKALDACLWLTSQDAGLWLDAADLPYGDPLQLLISGRLRKIPTNTKGRK